MNARRIAAGKQPATQCWLWGQGKAPQVHAVPGHCTASAGRSSRRSISFAASGRCSAGTASTCPASPAISTPTTPTRGEYAVEALGAFDLVCVHVEAPDEASHEGKADEKVKALERIDEHIVGPLLDALPQYGD